MTGINAWLYPKVNVFEERDMPLANILTTNGTLEAALELWNGNERYFPLALDGFFWDDLHISHSRWLFHDDPHYNEISAYFDSLEWSAFYYDRKNYKRPPLWYSHILNLPNTVQDVRLRQDGVKELVWNEALFSAVESLFQSLELYASSSSQWGDTNYSAALDPIKAKELLWKLSDLHKFWVQSQAIQNILDWTNIISTDSYFGHLVEERRKVDDLRIVSFYSDRYKGRVLATLKAWVKITDFCDIIPPSWEWYTDTVGRWKNAKGVERKVIRAESSHDTYLDGIPFAKVRQKIDTLKQMASASLSLPLFLALIQLKHLYLWSLMYKDFQKRDFPVCFPEISDEPFDLSFRELYPLWEVFKAKSEKKHLMANSLEFTPDEMIVHIKWANSCGKSEIFRSLHFATMLVNAWFPVPAAYYKSGIVPSSKFILFQGNAHSGSQLENAKRHVFSEFKEVLVGSNVILDEVWDATNAPTAAEMGERFIWPLREHGCRIFITTHHDALDPIIKNHWWVSLSPKQGAKGKRRYEIVRNDGEISYNAQETLDRLWVTRENISEILRGTAGKTRLRWKTPENKVREYDEEF